MTYTAEQIEKIKEMGNEWQKNGMHRIYISPADLAPFYGIETERYNTGNIMSARLDGKKISNSEAKRLLSKLHYSKFWFDMIEERFHCQGEMANTGMMQKIVAAIEAQLQEDHNG